MMLKVNSILFLGLVFVLFHALCPVLPATPLKELLTEPELREFEKEFRSLASELAAKADLFKDIWALDSQAEFFGGTSRDFLYWLKGRLEEAKDKEELNRIMVELRVRPYLLVKDFIVGESDIDLLTRQGVSVDGRDYGVKRVEPIDTERLDPAKPKGRTEREQGYIPVEKIRLTREGVITDAEFGNGVWEILTERPTVSHADSEVFKKTFYAAEGRNHQVFLALRYFRILAMNYYYSHGRGVPDLKILFDIDPESAKRTREIIQEALKDPELRRLVKNGRFLEKFNETVHKAFRVYTNPTAARELYVHFGAYELLDHFKGLEPINQYLYAERADPQEAEAHFKEYHINPETFLVKPKDMFPDGRVYHGAKKEEGFRSILLQGSLPSISGTAGRGLYGVTSDYIPFAKKWAKHDDRVVYAPVLENARIVDIKQGKGKEVFDAFVRKAGLRHKPYQEQRDDFCKYFGIDILRYPYKVDRNTWGYDEVVAVVMKNSEALGKFQGLTRSVLSMAEILEEVPEIKDEQGFERFLKILEVNHLTLRELKETFLSFPYFEGLLHASDSYEGLMKLLDEIKKVRPTSSFIETVMERVRHPGRTRITPPVYLRSSLHFIKENRSADSQLNYIQLMAMLERWVEIKGNQKEEARLRPLIQIKFRAFIDGAIRWAERVPNYNSFRREEPKRSFTETLEPFIAALVQGIRDDATGEKSRLIRNFIRTEREELIIPLRQLKWSYLSPRWWMKRNRWLVPGAWLTALATAPLVYYGLVPDMVPYMAGTLGLLGSTDYIHFLLREHRLNKFSLLNLMPDRLKRLSPKELDALEDRILKEVPTLSEGKAPVANEGRCAKPLKGLGGG